METKPQKKSSTENFVNDIRNKTRRMFTSEQKIIKAIPILAVLLSNSEYNGYGWITPNTCYQSVTNSSQTLWNHGTVLFVL